MYKLMVALLLAVAAVCANAQQMNLPEGASCNTREGRLKYATEYTNALYGIWLERVERVPPETERYLDAEYADVMKTRNEQRYQMLVRNPYYPAWRLRTEVSKVVNLARTGENAWQTHKELTSPQWRELMPSPLSTEVLLYIDLISASEDAGEEVRKYTAFDAKRDRPVVNEKDIPYTIALVHTFYKHPIRQLAACALK